MHDAIDSVALILKRASASRPSRRMEWRRLWRASRRRGSWPHFQGQSIACRNAFVAVRFRGPWGSSATHRYEPKRAMAWTVPMATHRY